MRDPEFEVSRLSFSGAILMWRLAIAFPLRQRATGNCETQVTLAFDFASVRL
jgi:hypothetical protein